MQPYLLYYIVNLIDIFHYILMTTGVFQGTQKV